MKRASGPLAHDIRLERRLWLALLAPPVLWGLHEISGYTVAAVACGKQVGAPSGTGVPLALGLIALLSSAITLWSLAISFRARRDLEALADRPREWTERMEFTALAAAIVSGLLLMNMVLFGLAPLLLDPCVRVR